MHWKICKYNGILDCEKCYKHQTEPIKEPKRAAILWDFAAQTSRKIKRSRLDIVVKDFRRKTCLLISVKKYNNVWKFKDLKIEIEKVSHLKTSK